MTGLTLDAVRRTFAQAQPSNMDFILTAALRWMIELDSSEEPCEPGLREEIERFLDEHL